jgi:hypothetical protein
MNKDIKSFLKILENGKEKLNIEYEELIATIQPYDISAFSSEFNSEYSYYSLRFFDEDKFKAMVKTKYDVDLDDPTVKELTIDDIYHYSYSYIQVEALRAYMISNNISDEVDDE